MRRANNRHPDLNRVSTQLLDRMKKRRSVRSFSSRSIPRQVIENCIAIAGSAPSGANMQPWTFVVVSDKLTKMEIKEQAETVEKEFYLKRVTDEWKDRLRAFNLSYKKDFLIEAPYLICIFAQMYGFDKDGKKIKHYYPSESVGIATGFLIMALHQLGISTLTYTPAPMTFLKKILKRPKNERPFLILAVGYPSEDYIPPDIEKKSIGQILIDSTHTIRNPNASGSLP